MSMYMKRDFSNKGNEYRMVSRKRYLYYKCLIQNGGPEAWKKFLITKSMEIFDHVKAMWTVGGYGFFVGLLAGGKWGGNGGIFVGGVLQLICVLVAPFIGWFHGICTGLMYGEIDGLNILRDYNYCVNSTMSLEMINKPNIVMRNDNKASKVMKIVEAPKADNLYIQPRKHDPKDDSREKYMK